MDTIKVYRNINAVDKFLGMESGQWWWAIFVATRTRVLPVLAL